MKDYTYKEKEIDLIRHLRNNPPKKIWWNFIWYVFDYEEYYLKLECEGEPADSQNNSDEAIIATLSRLEEKFEPSESTKLVCSDQKIDNAHIVRTFLYFTNQKVYSKPEKLTKRAIHKIKTALTGKKDPVGELISQTVAGYEEVICHPKSGQVKKTNPDHANLLDVGLLLEMNSKVLMAYLQNNAFGFHIWDNKFFFDPDELKNDLQLYDFIKI